MTTDICKLVHGHCQVSQARACQILALDVQTVSVLGVEGQGGVYHLFDRRMTLGNCRVYDLFGRTTHEKFWREALGPWLLKVL